jgi:hypothetical protein
VPRFEPADLSRIALDDLAALLQQELAVDIGRALGPVADHELYALALAIGEHATSVYVTANTEAHLLAVFPAADIRDPYLRWDCCGDWAVIADDTLKETNRFLFDVRRAHDAWLWTLEPNERRVRAADTWAVLDARLVAVLHDALRRLIDDGLPDAADQGTCVVCLLSVDDPEVTRRSARELNSPTAVAREFGPWEHSDR